MHWIEFNADVDLILSSQILNECNELKRLDKRRQETPSANITFLFYNTNLRQGRRKGLASWIADIWQQITPMHNQPIPCWHFRLTEVVVSRNSCGDMWNRRHHWDGGLWLQWGCSVLKRSSATSRTYEEIRADSLLQRGKALSAFFCANPCSTRVSGQFLCDCARQDFCIPTPLSSSFLCRLVHSRDPMLIDHLSQSWEVKCASCLLRLQPCHVVIPTSSQELQVQGCHPVLLTTLGTFLQVLGNLFCYFVWGEWACWLRSVLGEVAEWQMLEIANAIKRSAGRRASLQHAPDVQHHIPSVPLGNKATTLMATLNRPGSA